MLETTKRIETEKDFEGFDLNLQLFASDGEDNPESLANKNQSKVKNIFRFKLQIKIKFKS